MARKRNKNVGGDILGLSGSPIPDHGEAIRNLDREEEVHRRHRRMSEGADELTPEPSTPQRSSGATGIDMGSGGEGTDIE
jgi:hypothetical protein